MTRSIVIPVYNSEPTIGCLVDRLIADLGSDALQIVLVNDGSNDGTDGVCRGLVRRYLGIVTYVRLARNFGEHNAVMAGLHHAHGDYVVIMDDDFQNPPGEVCRLIEHARAGGYDVVYTRYARKHHHWARNLASRLNDRVATLMLEKPRDLYLSSFKCLARFTVQEILKYRGPYPYVDGLVLRCTRNIGTLAVTCRCRTACRRAPRRPNAYRHSACRSPLELPVVTPRKFWPIDRVAVVDEVASEITLLGETLSDNAVAVKATRSAVARRAIARQQAPITAADDLGALAR